MKFLKSSFKYLICLLLLMIIFILIKSYKLESVLKIDSMVMNFVQNHLIKDYLTPFFKVVTNLGGVTFFVIFLVVVLILLHKKFFLGMSLNLIITYVLSVIFKNIFQRERPLYNLISKPKDYSFPSGHTMCSVAFYGFLIYLVLNYVNNKFLKYFLVSLCVIVIVIIAFSRIYLNVHFFSDIVCGMVLGTLCLLMFIDYVKIKREL